MHGLGGFPSEHFLCLQMLGMHGTVYANYAINEADLLLAFGVRFDDRVTGKVSEFAKHGKIVHIDIDPSEINKNKVAHIPIHGDVGQALRSMLQLLDEEPNADAARGGRYGDWMRQIEEWREAEPLHFADRDDAILPQYAIDRLWQIVRDRKRTGRNHRDHRRRPASDVGGPVLPFQHAAHLDHQRRPRLDGLRPARGHGRPGGPSRRRPSSTSTATAAS